jgi:hypothetical protein
VSRRRTLVIGLVSASLLGLAVFGAVLTRTRGSTPAVALGPPHFIEEAAAAGLRHAYAGDHRFFAGGGVAVFDCSGDGRPELYLAGGSGPAALFRNESRVGGALRFAAVKDPVTDLPAVNGAYPLDIDGDGQVDLAVLRLGEDVLLRGLGGCRFERANETWSFDGGRDWTTAFSATWEGKAGLPTLAIGHYLGLAPAGKAPAEQTDTCADNSLVRPNPAGGGYGPAIVLAPGYCSMSMLFSDWDRSGRRDLRVSNDRQYYVDGEEQLWRIAPGQPPRRYTDADGWVRTQIWGMGIASHDVTGDGYPDVFLTSQGDNKLQTLTSGPAQPRYRDIALRRGVTAAQPFTGGDALPSTAWHPEFADVNNDGFIDLFISKGNVDAQQGFAVKDPTNLRLGQPDGTFKEAADAAGIVTYARGRGAALADLNLDGMLDLVEVNYGSGVELWRNAGSGDASRSAPIGRWLAVRLAQPGPNRDAIGAWIEVRVGDATLRRELTSGGGHAGGQLGWIHFGLGPADEAQLRAQWPDGETGPWLKMTPNTFAVIERGAAEPRPWPVPGP